MSVALTYDYSALPNLKYIWLDNVRYEKLNNEVYEEKYSIITNPCLRSFMRGQG